MSTAAIVDPAARRAIEALLQGAPVNPTQISDSAARRAVAAVRSHQRGLGPTPSLAGVTDPALKTELEKIIAGGK